MTAISVVHGPDNHLYPALQVIRKAWYPRQSSLDHMGKGPLHPG